jgi:hypothetical protein
MAKVSRDVLKQLVKECLFEILLESTDASPARLSESKRRRSATKPSPKKSLRSPRPALDSISFGGSKKERPDPQIDVSGITSDPVMASIFQDTAATTLREQIAAERHGQPVAGGDAASLAVANSDPINLFGEAASNWAALAFSDKDE